MMLNIYCVYLQNPDVPLFCSMRRVALIFLWFYTGLLPFIPLKETHFEIPHPYCFKRSVVEACLGMIYMIFLTLNFFKHFIYKLFYRTSFQSQLTNNQKRLFSIASFFLRSKVLFTHLKARGIPVRTMRCIKNKIWFEWITFQRSVFSWFCSYLDF